MSPAAVLVAAIALVSLLTHLTGSFYLAVALTALVPAGRYYWSVRSHPFTSCPRCKGAAQHRDPLMPWAKRECYACLGLPGRKIRWGSRTFTSFGRTAHREAKTKTKNARAAIRQKR